MQQNQPQQSILWTKIRRWLHPDAQHHRLRWQGELWQKFQCFHQHFLQQQWLIQILIMERERAHRGGGPGRRAPEGHQDHDPDPTSIAASAQCPVLFPAGKQEGCSQGKRTTTQMQNFDNSSRQLKVSSVQLFIGHWRWL